MPGRGSYGPGGKWVYQRAKHIRSKNPDMDESTSFAIATQQAHKVGKSLKSFRTAEGVQTAMAKMRKPVGEYKKTAAPRIRVPAAGKRLLQRARKVPLRPPTVNESLSLVEPKLSVGKREREREKSAMLRGLFDELEKISQGAPTPPPAPAPGMGGQSPGAIGAPGSSAPGGGGSGAVPPPKPPLVQPPAQSSGGAEGPTSSGGIGG